MQHETDRLFIRPFDSKDGADLFEYLSLESVVKYEPYSTFTEEACHLEAIRRSDDPSFWAVCLKSNEKLIGNIWLHKREPDEFMTWELGYVFNPEYAGKGYATESCYAIVNYTFAALGAHRIEAFCNAENISSCKLLGRLHMRKEGHRLKNAFFKKDVQGNPLWFDSYSYAILTDEWKQVPPFVCATNDPYINPWSCYNTI